ncbi:TPR repeat-containing protein [Thermobaculum terrenum ATCC BAA-798]|uniref:TPR repeat-containing protein n=1 Tax=Thermobaculum terrenum (strain ATCC BAA-798 / CCMEE 7001 / YNP1) TaxID=525904 RepID=D1CG23_THET1|nr:tetratricopeptide repeat protein [Thermobaculum terrenum]ACZ41879.1 TPR repeat-containing protein [Thermobaculum terrenum ATCC BAA-798]
MTIQSEPLSPQQRREKARLTDRAIDLSEQGKWQEAIEVNQKILEIDPRDVSAHNRIGRAYNEMGRLKEALQAYNETLKIDPANAIAKRNAARIQASIDALGQEEIEPTDNGPVNVRTFVMQPGRSGVVTLEDTPDLTEFATLMPGDPLQMSVDGPYLRVFTISGKYLGVVPADRANRLIQLMAHGNKYSVTVMHISQDSVQVIISETYRSPDTHGKLPFPPVTSRPAIETRAVSRAAIVEEEELVEELELEEELEEEETPITSTSAIAEAEDLDEIEEE